MTDKFVSYKEAPFAVLKAGIHELSLAEFKTLFVYNAVRIKQFAGLLKALDNLKTAGCSTIYIDGSYVTQKGNPGDYDACVDYTGVDLNLLDPVFQDFSNKRQAQKSKYEGEFFPHSCKADRCGTSYIDFFQKEKFSGQQKGIIKINLGNWDLNSLGGDK